MIAQIGEHDRIILSGEQHLPEFAQQVRGVAGVAEATVGDGHVEVSTDDSASALAGVVACAIAAGVTVTGVEVREPNLESVFLHLTGKALRDRAD